MTASGAFKGQLKQKSIMDSVHKLMTKSALYLSSLSRSHVY